jgi:hypothetical protein
MVALNEDKEIFTKIHFKSNFKRIPVGFIIAFE